MATHEDSWLQRARTIVEHLSSNLEDEDLEATDGFSIAEVDAGLLLSRRNQAIGIIRRQGESFFFIRVGHREPTTCASDVDDFLDRLAEVIAAALRPRTSIT